MNSSGIRKKKPPARGLRGGERVEIKLELKGAEELAEMIAKLKTQLYEAGRTLSAAQKLCWELEVKANHPPAGTDG